MRRAVLWDSSAILALLDRDDADHATAVQITTDLARQHRPCLITNYIEVEAHALLLRKLGRSLAREWLLAGHLPVVRATVREEERAKELVATHADQDWSLCEAISFAVMHLRRIGTAFSFDHHFGQYGRARVLGLS